MPPNQMIGLAEAAVELRVPYPTAHRLLLTGQLRGEKRGGRWFVRREDVNRVLTEQQTTPPAAA